MFRSLEDPDTLRGFTADLVVIDEAGMVNEAAWYQVLRPVLMDTGGGAWLIGTPNGRNWFWREYVQAANDDSCSRWNIPSLGARITQNGLIREPHPLENPDLDFEELVQEFRTMPERLFRQEILGEFIEDAGSVFRNVLQCVDKGRATNEPPSAQYGYVIGVDLARINDYTVITVLDDVRRQVALERLNEASWARMTALVERYARSYDAVVVVDATGLGDPVTEALSHAGISVVGVHLTSATKSQIVDRLAMDIEHGLLRLMDSETQTSELLAYQYTSTKAGNMRTSAPSGMHDDCVIALALANYGIGAPAGRRKLEPKMHSEKLELDTNRAGAWY